MYNMFTISYIFVYIFLISSCVCAILSSLVVNLQILSEFSILVAMIPPTLSVSMGGCPKDPSFGGSLIKEFARFIRSLELDSSMILEKTLFRLSSSILGDATFFSLVEDF